jgi:thymidine kinase
MTEMGYLGIFLGPMFSGKTTKIVHLYNYYTGIGESVAVINYSLDTRYHDTMLSTHDKVMIPCVMINKLTEAWESGKFDNVKVILINEGQFFEDLYDIVIDMVENKKKMVYICGLDGDFKRNKFGRMLDLIPFCDKCEKLNSKCNYCDNYAAFSHRITNEVEQVVIGSDNYVPLCRKCYNLLNP